ncbi:MAG: polysaccharide biosynthesis protein [Bacteroidia bacterium]
MLSNLKKIALQNIPRWVILVVDLGISSFSFILTCYLFEAFRGQEFGVREILNPLFVILLFRTKAFLITKSYTGILKYTSTQDAVRIVSAIFLSTLAMLVVEGLYFYATDLHLLNPGIILVDGFILTTLLAGFRIAFKLFFNYYGPNSAAERKRVIIYGAGEVGMLVKRSLEGDPKLNSKVVAFLDDNVKLQGKTLEGVRIHSPEVDFDQLVFDEREHELIIAIQNLKPWRKKRVIEKCLSTNISAKTIPPVGTWFNGQFNARQIKKVRIEALLEREPIQLDKAKISKELNNKVILITGAAGSIGSEIARQCLAFKPKKLVLLDQAETPVYHLQNQLKAYTQAEVVIADVCNQARLRKVFDYYKPSYVFHAAAYKHVPLMENNPYEAINTNVFGTQTVANLAVEFKAEKFVLVSTDKAVNPTNIMGASKRIAEIYVQSLNAKLNLDSDQHTKFITTRFGNVLGSNGSVIPIFEKQIEAGGPITVTHPEITRYFMTIPEACQLVLEAGVMGKGGEIYIFDMGESVKIIDLAKKMIRLSGFKVGKDIDIVYTGLRPGEKLKEELLNDKENTVGTHNPKIMIAKVPKYNYLEVNEVINKLYKEKDQLTNRFLVKTMKRIVPEYVSNNSIYEELDKQFIES